MRKIILTVLGCIEALFGLFGIALNVTSLFTGMSLLVGALLLAAFVITEGKKDLQDFLNGVKQSNKWGDPAFWTAVLSSIVLPILGLFGVTLTPELMAAIGGVLAILIPILLSLLRKRVPA